jgi:hypothetical protein
VSHGGQTPAAVLVAVFKELVVLRRAKMAMMTQVAHLVERERNEHGRTERDARDLIQQPTLKSGIVQRLVL